MIARHSAAQPRSSVARATVSSSSVTRCAPRIGRRRSSITLVSNEVGEGVHPETAIGLRFRDLLGGVNQRVAAVCDSVVLMVAGIPLTVKAPAARP